MKMIDEVRKSFTVQIADEQTIEVRSILAADVEGKMWIYSLEDGQLFRASVQEPTTLLHEQLTPKQTLMCYVTWNYAGRFRHEAFEQWEREFLQEKHPSKELRFWMLVSMVIAKMGYGTEETVNETRFVIDQFLLGSCRDDRIQAIANDCKQNFSQRAKELVREFRRLQKRNRGGGA